MSALSVRPLDPSTWADFARLVEAHRGVWGGCWCMGFHPEGFGPDNRGAKETRVRSGQAHAALVFDGDEAVGWCQYGPTDELTRIKHRRAYEKELATLPDWRIVCFFVANKRRRHGIASAALAGALEQIEKAGGGVVESYPEDTTDRKTSGSFLHNGTLAMFERAGFERDRQIGKHAWVVTKTIP
ncbi:GNAT family N-acetyltransferase [Kribbella sp. NPDC023855]|uniref:GNAT family N-acetyltransferase n=1 Tax=Kribbella sp. NPDC023855 TaxID=3154698 RepID=UPI0033CCD078